MPIATLNRKQQHLQLLTQCSHKVPFGSVIKYIKVSKIQHADHIGVGFFGYPGICNTKLLQVKDLHHLLLQNMRGFRRGS